jgi:hypothetical protein
MIGNHANNFSVVQRGNVPLNSNHTGTLSRLFVPEDLLKKFTRNQATVLTYMHFRCRRNPLWKFHAVELVNVLKHNGLRISRQCSYKMLLAFTKRGVLNDLGNKRIEIPRGVWWKMVEERGLWGIRPVGLRTETSNFKRQTSEKLQVSSSNLRFVLVLEIDLLVPELSGSITRTTMTGINGCGPHGHESTEAKND